MSSVPEKPKLPFKERFAIGAKKQLEGFYSTKPKHLTNDITPGLKYQSIPMALKQHATHPLQALKEDWRSMGSQNPAKQQAWRPSMMRAFALLNAGMTANAVRKAGKLDRPEAIGSAIGSNVGMLVGNRLPLLANIALWSGADAAGRKLGRMYAKRKYGYNPKTSFDERPAPKVR